jgi:hypothetical protein
MFPTQGYRKKVGLPLPHKKNNNQKIKQRIEMRFFFLSLINAAG